MNRSPNINCRPPAAARRLPSLAARLLLLGAIAGLLGACAGYEAPLSREAFYATVTAAMGSAGTDAPLPTSTPTEVPTEAPTEAPSATPVPPTEAPPAPTEIPSPTVEPSPTPEPWPEPIDAPGRSKLGLHVILNDDPRILEFVRRAKPRVMKAVDNFDWLQQVKEASPQTITIGRQTRVPNRNALDDKTPDQYPDPAAFARDFITLFMPDYQANPWVDYWEGWNEYPAGAPSRWSWYAQFEAERACQMQALGFKAAIGGFGAGWPEYADMAYFLPALHAAARCGAIFTLHEYSSPVMQFGVGAGIPNAINLPQAGSLTLRYRYWYEGYLKPQGLNVPLVISEAGVESRVGPGCPVGGDGGWQKCAPDWVAAGLSSEPKQAYLTQLEWYDAELQKDDYVWGAALFTAGAHASSDWSTFNLDNMLVPLAWYMVGIR